MDTRFSLGKAALFGKIRTSFLRTFSLKLQRNSSDFAGEIYCTLKYAVVYHSGAPNSSAKYKLKR